MSVSKTAEIITLPVYLRIKNKTLEVLTKGRATAPSDVIASFAQQMLDVIAEGGIILNAQDVSDISTNCGKAVGNNRDIVKATESKSSKRDGQLVLTAIIDPAYESPLQEAARMGGHTLEEHCTEIMNNAAAQGWFLDIADPGIKRVFSKEQEAWLAKEIGLENFSVAELIGYIKANKRGKKSVDPQVDTAETVTA